MSWLRRNYPWVLLGLGALALLLLAAAGGLYLLLREDAPAPAVQLQQIVPDDPATAQEPVLVRGVARDPTGVARVELWINGKRIAVQQAQDEPDSMTLHQAWFPTGPGNFSVVLRAVNAAGTPGQSQPRILQVQERDFAGEEENPMQVVVEEDMTVEEFTERYGFSPSEAENPPADEMLEEGVSLIGSRADEEWESEPGAAEPPPEGVPGVEPALEPVPTGGSGVPAERMPWYGSIDLAEICRAAPSICNPSRWEATEPPAAVGDLFATAGPESCRVGMGWIDRSINEDGFRVWRRESAPDGDWEVVAELAPVPGQGNPLGYEIPHGGRGLFLYGVAAFNEAGSTMVPAPSSVETRCASTIEGDQIPIVVEAIRMNVEPEVDRIYCYASLAASPFERIPAAEGRFIRNRLGRWNIARYFSGDNQRRLLVDRDEPLEVQGMCGGRRGGDLVPLGRFTRRVPPRQWDGTELGVGPEDGTFNVVIRVFLTSEDDPGSDRARLIDPDIPPPTDLRRADSWRTCSPLIGGTCLEHEEDGLRWKYPLVPVGEPSVNFRVFRRGPGEARSEQVHWTFGPARSAPLLAHDSGCVTEGIYSVSAVTQERAPVTGDLLESPPSEEFEVENDCIELLVTLVQYIHDTPIKDGTRHDRDAESYGRLWVGSREVVWNFHCHDGCLRGDIPNTTSTTNFWYTFADFYLNSGDGWAQGNHQFIVKVAPDENLDIDWQFKDHDSWSADDNLCRSTRTTGSFAADGTDGWRNIDERKDLRGDKCIVRVRVQGADAR